MSVLENNPKKMSEYLGEDCIYDIYGSEKTVFYQSGRI